MRKVAMKMNESNISSIIKINMQKLIKIQNKQQVKSAKIRRSSDYGINEKKISEFICIEFKLNIYFFVILFEK